MNENQRPGPFDQDTLGTSKKALPEKDFIQESREPPQIGPLPLWLWLALIIFTIALIWGSANWFQQTVEEDVRTRPFLEVTNREFSLFLWQFPNFMRAYAPNKTAYLTGFQYANKQTMDLTQTEEFVAAPPEILFLYHTWRRLLSADLIQRPISSAEFVEFLKQVEEWQPRNWKNAPAGYVTFIESEQYNQTENLQTLPESVLPMAVRQAFQGWKNYAKEGPAINQIEVTFGELEAFLKEHPHYARNYWRNIQEVANREVAGAHYLESFVPGAVRNSEEKVPKEQLSPFLKVALYNAQQAKN